MIPLSRLWRPRIGTRTGYAVAPDLTHLRKDGQASTAQRRRAERIHDRAFVENIVTLEPGTLVVYERAPYRVMEVREVPPDLWHEEDVQAFECFLRNWDARPWSDERPTPETWRNRPIAVAIHPDGAPGRKYLHTKVSASYSWDVLPEHYSICKACGELAPCSHEVEEQHIQRHMAQAQELMSIVAGNCMSCGEGFTPRMKKVYFPGPNLWRPDLPEGTAVFHARRECSHSVAQYSEQFLTSESQLKLGEQP